MSIQTLKIELESRGGRELLPSFFPIELLIALKRELALVADRALSCEELQQMTAMMRNYLRRVVEMHGTELLKNFDGRAGELLPPLVQELYDFLSEEIVSRLIGYDVCSESLRDRFAAVLAGVDESA